MGDVDQTIMLTSVPAAEQWADRLNSITVHPAAVVAAMNPRQEASVRVVDQPEAADAVDIDSIMEELSQSDWWSIDPVEAEDSADTPEEAVVELVEDLAASPVGDIAATDENGQPLSAAALGLMLAGMTKPVRRRKDD